MADYSRKTPQEVIAEKKEQDEADQRTPAYRNGFSDAIHDRKFDPSHMDTRLYTLGFRNGESAAGKRPEESAVPVERVRPSDPADAQRHGYEEGRDLMKSDPRTDYDEKEKEAYLAGFRQGMLEKINEGAITVNKARELLGYHPFEEPPTTMVFLSENFDPPLLFPKKVENDPVKVPSHYTRGKIEVANFIADQQLPYPLDNVVKYACRAGHKEGVDALQDLEKMAAYLQMAHNIANGKPAVVRDPDTNEVVWTLFQNEPKPNPNLDDALKAFTEYKGSGPIMGSDGRDHAH